MEFKGTKGKWSFQDNDGVYDELGLLIARLPTADAYNENEANAKLIAAAPDLLEALQVYLNAGNKEARREASVQAKKAIEKALS